MLSQQWLLSSVRRLYPDEGDRRQSVPFIVSGCFSLPENLAIATSPQDVRLCALYMRHRFNAIKLIVNQVLRSRLEVALATVFLAGVGLARLLARGVATVFDFVTCLVEVFACVFRACAGSFAAFDT